MSKKAKAVDAVSKEDQVEVYERVMSENEFRIRRYPKNEIISLATGRKSLRLIQFCYNRELAMADLDLTQAFKTGWLQPGYRMTKAFGHNFMSSKNEMLLKLKEFMKWLISTYIREAKGLHNSTRVTTASLNPLEILGVYGKGTPRYKFLEWLKTKNIAYADIKATDKYITGLCTEYLGDTEEKQFSPVWLEVAFLVPNPEDPAEVHACEDPIAEDPNLVVRVGFKQHDLGYFVLMPKMAAFHRTVAGVFTEIPQRSYYPYYPFTDDERDCLVAAMTLAKTVVDGATDLKTGDPCVDTLRQISAKMDFTKFIAELREITNDRGAQDTEGKPIDDGSTDENKDSKDSEV